MHVLSNYVKSYCWNVGLSIIAYKINLVAVVFGWTHTPSSARRDNNPCSAPEDTYKIQGGPVDNIVFRHKDVTELLMTSVSFYANVPKTAGDNNFEQCHLCIFFLWKSNSREFSYSSATVEDTNVTWNTFHA